MTTPQPPLPADLHVRLDPDVLVRDGGRLLCGGTPFRLIRLSPDGASVIARWQDGHPLGDAPTHARLARRLLDAGIVLTASTPTGPPPGAIIVPARDRVAALRRCLAALRPAYPDVHLVVVDDGSIAADNVAALAREHRAELVRHDTPRGPSAARNSGLRRTTAALIAFVDSDVVVDPGCLERLTSHFGDPAVAAAAPRVLPTGRGTTRLSRYEAADSSLDMGPRPARAAPGHRVSYVPSTTLVARHDALPDGAFAEDLRVGEDVDLVWRLHSTGHHIVYDPEATVRHDHRTRPPEFWRRRFDYARSIGPLARRHRHAIPALHAEPWSTAVIASLILRRPGLAVIVAAARWWSIRRLVGRSSDRPGRLAGTLLARSFIGTSRGLGHAIRRSWSPLLLAAGARRPRVLVVLALAEIGHATEHGLRHPADGPLLVADDLIAAAGSWVGCAEARTPRPLLPARFRATSRSGRGGLVHEAQMRCEAHRA